MWFRFWSYRLEDPSAEGPFCSVSRVDQILIQWTIISKSMNYMWTDQSREVGWSHVITGNRWRLSGRDNMGKIMIHSPWGCNVSLLIPEYVCMRTSNQPDVWLSAKFSLLQILLGKIMVCLSACWAYWWCCLIGADIWFSLWKSVTQVKKDSTTDSCFPDRGNLYHTATTKQD